MPQKSDAEAIQQFLQGLAQEDWIHHTERRWWPLFLFHYTDIRNAAQVLQDGFLYSRLHAEVMGKMAVSSGSPRVLSGTDHSIKDFVRLYFRPKTPTQYHAEGVHSFQSLEKSAFPEAHCPTPVFFLFDSAEILGRSDCLFSNRGLGGQSYQIGSNAEELRGLPWQQIYHNSWVAPESARQIIASRNAEVVIPKKMDLSALRYIYCRSEAEKDTFLYLLSPDLRKQYRSKIVASVRSNLFFRKRTFLESVTLMSNNILLRFSPDTECPGPFHLRIKFKAEQTLLHEVDGFMLGQSYDYAIKLPRATSDYQVQVMLDEHLVYANAYQERNIPF
mgnify:CR=1 FL=1|jgi:hypothetical protein